MFTAAANQHLFNRAIVKNAPVEYIADIYDAADVDVNYIISTGLRPIHYASYNNNEEALDFLIRHGAHLNITDEVGCSPLHLASERGSYQTTTKLVESGSRVNWQRDLCYDRFDNDYTYIRTSDVGVDPLFKALEARHFGCAAKLVEYGANPNCRYFMGNHISLIDFEDARVLSFLLDSGANPNVLDRRGKSPLMQCVILNNINAVVMLLESSADSMFPSTEEKDSVTAFFYAVSTENYEVVLTMLEKEGDIPLSKPVKKDVYALELAIQRDSPKMVTLLLRQGADPNQLNRGTLSAVSPLQVACTTPHLKQRTVLIQILLDHGANPNYFSDCKTVHERACFSPIVEYFMCNTVIDFVVLFLLIHYGAIVHLTNATLRHVIVDPFGLLRHYSMVEDCNSSATLLLSAASKIDLKALHYNRQISHAHKAWIRTNGIPSLYNSSRFTIRRHLERPIVKSADRLHLPTSVYNFIMFNNHLD